jgi:hypothetical protein
MAADNGKVANKYFETRKQTSIQQKYCFAVSGSEGTTPSGDGRSQGERSRVESRIIPPLRGTVVVLHLPKPKSSNGGEGSLRSSHQQQPVASKIQDPVADDELCLM